MLILAFCSNSNIYAMLVINVEMVGKEKQIQVATGGLTSLKRKGNLWGENHSYVVFAIP